MIALSLDFGTSSIKAGLVDEAGNLLGATASAPYAYQLLPGEKVELREKDMLDAMVLAVSRLDPELRARADYLCYDTFSPSLVLLDEDGKLLTDGIITHLDRRSRAYSRVVDKVFGNIPYLNTTGFLPFAGGCSLMTLLWFKDHEPERFSQARHVGHLPTYLYHLFTGRFAVDRVNASMLGVYSTVKDTGWSEDILSAFDLPKHAFGDICQPGTILGRLADHWAEIFGVKKDLPVALGTNDMAAAQVGAGNRRSGCVLNVAGSSDMIGILTDTPAVSTHYYLRCSADAGLWQMYSTTAGGFALDWFHEQFCRELTDKGDFYQMVADVLSEAGDQKAKSTFLPYLSGDRQSLRKKTGAFNGLTLGSTREDMLLALMHGIQSVLWDTFQRAGEVTKLEPVIKITGGMVNPAYLKLKSLYFDPYRFEEIQNCPLRGNALLIHEP